MTLRTARSIEKFTFDKNTNILHSNDKILEFHNNNGHPEYIDIIGKKRTICFKFHRLAVGVSGDRPILEYNIVDPKTRKEFSDKSDQLPSLSLIHI